MAGFNEKSKAAYNKKADHYDDTFDGRFTRNFKNLLLSAVSLRENSNVLDVACGNGSLLAAFHRQTPITGGHGHGDLQESGLQESQGQPCPGGKLCLLQVLHRPLSKSWREQFRENV
jgi:ubiquinone/menaquinone biosynthesis C-methylase UbiE